MPPDPPLVSRLARHGQEHLLRWWDELDADERAGLVSEIEGIDFEGLDDADRDPGPRRGADVPAPDRVRPVDVHRLPRTDGERVARRHSTAIGAAALAAGEVAVVVVAGGLGHSPRLRRPQGDLPDRPGLRRQPLPDPRREDRGARQAVRPAAPPVHHDQPREPRGDRPLLRRERAVRPRSRPLLRPGADAGRRPRIGEDPPRREGPPGAQPRRPRRDAQGAGGPRPRRRAELPRRDARARHPHDLLLPGRQPAGQDRRPGLPGPAPRRPTPRCRSRSSRSSRPRRSSGSW